jgi:hypothetical protein
MAFSLTIFRNVFDNETSKRMDFESWEDFEKLLYGLSKKPGYKAKRGEFHPDASPLISPATYTRDSTRANANVLAWAGWAALDVDNYDLPFEQVLEKYKKNYFVCYSTASSTKEKPKFRLVFPLKHEVDPKNIKHFWFALNREFDSVGDEQCKDFSRMYYVPAQYPNAHNFIFTNKGEFVDPFELLAKHPFVEKKSNSFLDSLPEHVRKELLEHRKDQATNTGIRWTSWHDCPFMNKKLVKEYQSIATIDGTGRYRMIYKIMSAIACQAVRMKYPIQAGQIADLVRGLDRETSRKYQKRPLEKEAERAIEYAYKSVQ